MKMYRARSTTIVLLVAAFLASASAYGLYLKEGDVSPVREWINLLGLVFVFGQAVALVFMTKRHLKLVRASYTGAILGGFAGFAFGVPWELRNWESSEPVPILFINGWAVLIAIPGLAAGLCAYMLGRLAQRL